MSTVYHLADRRQNVRHLLDRPVKLRCKQTGRYLAGRTRDASSTGALIEIDHPSLLVTGQCVSVGIAWSSRQVLLTNTDLVDATVVRSLALTGTQHVAVQFSQPQALARTA